MPSVKDEAEAYRFALLRGWVSPSTVIDWADQIIARENHPDIAFIDTSLANRAQKGQVAEVLLEIPGKADPSVVRQALARVLLRRFGEGGLNLRSVAKELFRESVDEDDLFADYMSDLIHIDDAFDLAIAGISQETTTDAERMLLQLLQKIAEGTSA